jgi:hypothetical protein
MFIIFISKWSKNISCFFYSLLLLIKERHVTSIFKFKSYMEEPFATFLNQRIDLSLPLALNLAKLDAIVSNT